MFFKLHNVQYRFVDLILFALFCEFMDDDTLTICMVLIVENLNPNLGYKLASCHNILNWGTPKLPWPVRHVTITETMDAFCDFWPYVMCRSTGYFYVECIPCYSLRSQQLISLCGPRSIQFFVILHR